MSHQSATAPAVVGLGSSRVWPSDYNWHHGSHRFQSPVQPRWSAPVPPPLHPHNTVPTGQTQPSPGPVSPQWELPPSQGGPPLLHLKPPGFYVPWLMTLAMLGRPETESPSRGFTEVYSWSTVDFEYPSSQARELAADQGFYSAESNLPLGVEVAGGRIFVTLPRWKPGVPATLATLPLHSQESSPKLQPYPDWSWHSPDGKASCSGLTSVFRLAKDGCGRLWVIDSGVVELTASVKHLCPPQILVFDLHTDTLLYRYRIPKKQVPSGALFTNIAVEVMGSCEDSYAYVNDVFRFGLVVFSLREKRSWRVEHPYFFPDPLTSKYELDKIKFTWNDGIFGLALSPIDVKGSRYLFFHPMSSFREFHVETSLLKNESLSKNADDIMYVIGEPRYNEKGQASGSAMDRNGVLFYNLVTQSAVGCWNSELPHYPETQGIVEKNETTLNFPNDLKVDDELDQGLWVLSNRLHKFLYDKLDPTEINFRLMKIRVQDAVRGTPCEKGFTPPPRPSRNCG